MVQFETPENGKREDAKRPGRLRHRVNCYVFGKGWRLATVLGKERVRWWGTEGFPPGPDEYHHYSKEMSEVGEEYLLLREIPVVGTMGFQLPLFVHGCVVENRSAWEKLHEEHKANLYESESCVRSCFDTRRLLYKRLTSFDADLACMNCHLSHIEPVHFNAVFHPEELSLGKLLELCRKIELFWSFSLESVGGGFLEQHKGDTVLRHPSLPDTVFTVNTMMVLRVLIVKGLSVTKDFIRSLRSARCLETLAVTDAELTGTDGNEMGLLLEQRHSLRNVDLSGNRLFSEDVEILCLALQKNRTLVHLDLRGNPHACDDILERYQNNSLSWTRHVALVLQRLFGSLDMLQYIATMSPLCILYDRPSTLCDLRRTFSPLAVPPLPVFPSSRFAYHPSCYWASLFASFSVAVCILSLGCLVAPPLTTLVPLPPARARRENTHRFPKFRLCTSVRDLVVVVEQK